MSVVPLLRSLTAAALLLCAVPAFASFKVDTDVDADNPNDGHCSLREAITAVNQQSSYHECVGSVSGDSAITFAIGPNAGEDHVIALTGALPIISRAVTIDATTQHGTVCGPVPNVRVQITNPSALAIDGLAIENGPNPAVSPSLVKGIAISGFSASQMAGLVVERSDVAVGCSLFGTDPTGTMAQPNYFGVYINGQAAVIGIASASGSMPNLISGNSMVNLYIDAGGADTVVAGNYIGVDSSGMTALPSAFGIYTYQVAGLSIGFADSNVPAAQQRNVIAVAAPQGTMSVDVEFDSAFPDDAIAGNYIGVGADGQTVLPIGTGIGFAMYRGSGVLIGCNGVDAPADCRNVIANPNGSGVVIFDGSDKAAIVGNYFGVGADGTTVLDATQNAVGVELRGVGALVARNIISSGGIGTGVLLSPNGANQTPVFSNQASAGIGGSTLDSSENCVQANGFGIAVADASNPTELSTDFLNNWWGASDGPGPNGSGNPVASNVVYSPFLTKPSLYCGGGSNGSTGTDTVFANGFD